MRGPASSAEASKKPNKARQIQKLLQFAIGESLRWKDRQRQEGAYILLRCLKREVNNSEEYGGAGAFCSTRSKVLAIRAASNKPAEAPLPSLDPAAVPLCSHQQTWLLLDTGTVEECLMDEDVACFFGSLPMQRSLLCAVAFADAAAGADFRRLHQRTPPPPAVTDAPTPVRVRRLVSKQEVALVDSDEPTPGKHKFRKILPEC